MLFRSRADIRILHTIEYIAGFGGGAARGHMAPEFGPQQVPREVIWRLWCKKTFLRPAGVPPGPRWGNLSTPQTDSVTGA